MSGKPFILSNIDDLAKHVQATMARNVDAFPGSISRQVGKMLAYCLRKHVKGELAHPGVKRIAAMGGCSHRQAQRNCRAMENWGVLIPAKFAKGGRWATRYRFDLSALKRVLVSSGCNPSRELCAKIDAISDSLRGDMRGDARGDICYDTRHDTMSPGIQVENTPLSNVVMMRHVGGRADGL